MKKVFAGFGIAIIVIALISGVAASSFSSHSSVTYTYHSGNGTSQLLNNQNNDDRDKIIITGTAVNPSFPPPTDSDYICTVKIDKIVSFTSDYGSAPNCRVGDEVPVYYGAYGEYTSCGTSDQVKTGDKVKVYGVHSVICGSPVWHTTISICGKSSYYLKKIGSPSNPLSIYVYTDKSEYKLNEPITIHYKTNKECSATLTITHQDGAQTKYGPDNINGRYSKTFIAKDPLGGYTVDFAVRALDNNERQQDTCYYYIIPEAYDVKFQGKITNIFNKYDPHYYDANIKVTKIINDPSGTLYVGKTVTVKRTNEDAYEDAVNVGDKVEVYAGYDTRYSFYAVGRWEDYIKKLPEEKKPDLIIQDISWSPSNPKQDDTVKINVKTKNQGSGSAGRFYVCYYVDGSYYDRDYVSSLSAGSTTTTSFTWTAECGNHAIKAVADCYDAVAESDETNNAKIENINIICKPDLIIQDITWSPSNPKEGDDVEFTVTVKNQESESAGASYVYYYIDGSYVDYDYVPALSAGSTSTQSFTWTANKCGNVQVKAAADATNAVDESNEGNNEKTKTVSVACQRDLKIIDISTSRAFPELGERLWVYVTVKNTGTTAIDTNTKFNLDVSFVDKVSVPRIHTGPAQRNGEYTFDILTKTSDVNTNLAPGDSGKYTFFWDKIPDDPAYQLILANTIRAHLYTDDYTLDQIYEETILMNLNPKSQLRCLAMSIAIKFPQTAPYIEATEKGISATEDFVNLFDALDKNEYDKAAKSFSDLLKMMVEQTIDDPLTSLIDMIKMILEYGKCFVENVIFLWNCIGHIQEWCPDFRATVFASECPVDIIVTNEQGQKIGCSQGQIINEIENADIFVKEDNKYIIIFDDGDFDVELTSTGKGEADIYVGLPNQEGIFEYADIPISQNTKAKININKSNPNNLMDIDYNGDGIIDEKKTPEMIEVTTPTTIVFEDDFGELNFNNWIPFGSPSPHVLASVEGRIGVFDNNGDANCNSGVVSKDNFSFPNGFIMESDVYLNVTNVAGCWNSPVIGLTRQNKPTGVGVCPSEDYPMGVIFGTEYDGDACWATPPEKRRHAYFIIGLYTEEGTWESVSWLNADDYTDAWHNFKIAVGSDRIVKFYVDNDLIYTSEKRINETVLQEKKIFLGLRSSNSAGKSYHDFIKVYTRRKGEQKTIDIPIRAGEDDGFATSLLSQGNLINDSSSISIGQQAEDVFSLKFAAYLRFSNITIPTDAKISKAYITVVPTFTNRTGPLMKITAANRSNPTAPKDYSDYSTRNKTEASVDWNASYWYEGVSVNSPDISSIIQELVDSYDYNYSTGASMLIFLDDIDEEIRTKYQAFAAYEHLGYEPAKLHIEYIVPDIII